jgi:carbon storage regulator
MLVFSRKVGQEVVLPECGATIEVVNIRGNQVRLGIVAPPTIRVHRGEVWQRIRSAETALPEEHTDTTLPAPLPDGPRNGSRGGRKASADADLALARTIAERISDRACVLTVQTTARGTIISGFAGSYYMRQLMQAAIYELLGACDLPSPDGVQYNIQVVDRREAESRT